MRDEDYLNRLRALSNQQNVPLRVKPAETPQIPQQYSPTFNKPTIKSTPQPQRQVSPYSFPQQAQSYIAGAGSQLGGGLLRLGLRAVPTAARFTPMGAASFISGKLGGRDIVGEAQRKGEELARESERRQAAEIARQPDQAAARRGMQFGSLLKGTAEAGLMITPVGAASRAIQGTKLFQAGIKARPAISLATRVGENILSGTPATVIGILQEVGRGNKPNVAKEALIGSAIDALIPVVGKGYNALKSPQVRNILTGITDKFTVKGVIKSLDETLPEKAVEDAAESIAKSTNPEEIGRIIDDISVEPVRTTVPEVPSIPTPTAPVSAAISQTVDATARELSRTTEPATVKLAIDALFPNLDEATRTNLSNTIARTTDPETVKTSLEQAQKRSDELSATIAQETPPVQTETQRQAEAAAQLVENQPVRIETPSPVTRTPEAPTPTAVQGAASPQAVAQPTQVTPQPNLSRDLYQTETPTPEQQLSVLQRISPNRIAREYVTTPIQNYVNRLIGAAQISEVAPVRFLGRTATGVSRELGVTPELLAARKKFLQGTAELGKLTREDIVKLGNGIDDTVNQRVWATLDPDLAAAKGIKITPADLTPEESSYRQELVAIRDALTNGNQSRGLITDEQAAANWLKRGYKLFDFAEAEAQGYQSVRKGLLGQFKGRKDINENLLDEVITDPSYLLAKKSADSYAAWAMVDYSNWLANNNFVSDVARPGFRQLPSNKLYGAASGKYVPTNISEDFTGFQFNNGALNAMNELLTAYDNIKLRKAKKAILTVLNPAVRLGNEVSNRAIFAQLSGINPVTFNVNFQKVKGLKASRDPLYIEAVRRGLTGLDITQKEFANKVAEYMGEPNQAQKAWTWAKESYSGADDNARLAAFKTFVDRGYDFDEAARLTQRAFQDYKSVGYFYDIASKTPIVGNAFARFAGDAARILTNRLVDQPFTLAGSVAGIWALGELLSRKSGETAEDKAAREGRFGAPRIPFTNVSLELQTPWGAVNVARFMPFYNLNEINGNLTKFLPIAGNPLDPKNYQDPLLGQVLQLITDKDFRGKSIKEPENIGQFRTPTEGKTALENRIRFVVSQNAPLGKEIDALVSAVKSEPDVYGGERSLKQAVARAFGIKVQKFGPEEVQKLKDNEAFFADKKFIDDQLATLPKDSQEKYKKLTGYYKIREQIEDVFNPGKKRFKKEPVFAFSEDKYKELSSDPKLYDLLLTQKTRDNQRDGKPIPPEFDIRLSNEFRRQLIENKSLRPGDDLEADERMYNSPEWDTYQTIKKEYTDANKKFYPQTSGEFNDELVKHQNAQFPDKPAAYKAYSDAYAAFAKGQGPKPTFNDAVKAGKDEYNQAKLDWVNKERKARGLAPISPEVWNNVTFGFTSDEEKVYNELRFGRGLGGFGFAAGSETSPEYKSIMAALRQLGVTVKPLEIISAAPRRNVRLARVRVPTSRRTRRIQLR